MTQADPTATLIETIAQRTADIVLERLGNVGTQTGSEWPEIMPPRVAAAYLRIHVRTLHRLAKNGIYHKRHRAGVGSYFLKSELDKAR